MPGEEEDVGHLDVRVEKAVRRPVRSEAACCISSSATTVVAAVAHVEVGEVPLELGVGEVGEGDSERGIRNGNGIGIGSGL